jgi:putative addiction module killer protein
MVTRATSASLGGGVWESRLMFGPGYRIYFGKESRSIILLPLGGDTLGSTWPKSN